MSMHLLCCLALSEPPVNFSEPECLVNARHWRLVWLITMRHMGFSIFEWARPSPASDPSDPPSENPRVPWTRGFRNPKNGVTPIAISDSRPSHDPSYRNASAL
jgi:hypothetical protein